MTDEQLLELFSLFQCQLVTHEVDADYYKNLIINQNQEHTPTREYQYMFVGFVGGLQLGLLGVEGTDGTVRQGYQRELTAMIKDIDSEWILKEVIQFIVNIQK